jgi:pimeloyl-ACP methyl ester carboxylesterase
MKPYLSTAIAAHDRLAPCPPQTFEQTVVQANGLVFWTESFGEKENPAIILIMGSGGQGILWHQKFCELLANEGFFVIRYDHRDVGLSSIVDYQNSPYDLLDMAKDVAGIQDAYGIQKSHVVGMSLGGLIAMLMGAHFPDRVASLTLMQTTSDMRSNFAALQGKPSQSPLSLSHAEIVEWVHSFATHPPKTPAEKMEKLLEGGRIQTGSKVPFDEELNYQLTLQSIARTHDMTSIFNHLKAAEVSYDLYTQAASNIKMPTLILQGELDPIFPMDHGESLKKAIPHAQMEVIKDMGHGLNTHFYNVLVEKIVELAK